MATKKTKDIAKKLPTQNNYSFKDAIKYLKQFASKNMDESVDLAFNLGVDPRKADQMVRGAVALPCGLGKKVRVAVFAQGENAKKAEEAGADIVGFEDLAAKVKEGFLDFDVVIATPDAMRVLGKLGQILGPRGLMPNPKVGTVTPNVEAAVKTAKSGQVRYKVDKFGLVHAAIGKISFSEDKILKNVNALLNDINKVKPISAKGVYLKKLTISTTMGPGLVLDISSING